MTLAKFFKLWLRVELLGACGLVGVVLWANLASAQVSSDANLLMNSTNPERSNDPFNNQDGSASSLMNLIHNAVLGPSKSTAEFNAEQKENLDSAAAEFRARQQALLKQRQAEQSGTPIPAVVPIAPTSGSTK